MSTPQKFRNKPMTPATIEAMQLVGSAADWHAVYLWVKQNTLGLFEALGVIEGLALPPESGVSIDPRDGRMVIATLGQLRWANPGDWIVRGVNGEFYPVKPDIFDKTYEPAGDDQ